MKNVVFRGQVFGNRSSWFCLAERAEVFSRVGSLPLYAVSFLVRFPSKIFPEMRFPDFESSDLGASW